MMSRPAKKPKDFTNQDIAKILSEMAAFYEMQNVPFKPRAYEKAAQAVASCDLELSELFQVKGKKGFLEIPGVGQGIAEHLAELAQTGKLKIYEQFKKKFPVDIAGLTAVEGIGPKTIKILYEKLKIKNPEDLKTAVLAHKIRNLPGFGEKSEKNILAGLEFCGTHTGRFVLGFVEPLVQEIIRRLEDSGFFQKVEVAGSFRRRQETVGDIDILAISKNPQKAMEYFINLPEISKVLERGKTKTEIRLESGLQIDLRIVPEASWGAALQYFTGDKSHNIKLRKIAIEKGLKLSEYELTVIQKSKVKNQKHKSKFKGEEEIYNALGMEWIPPELRTDSGEIEAASRQAQGLRPGLPKLLNYGEVRGDLQVQTDWTDGTASIEEMAKAAIGAGLEYIAITDHTKSLAMTGGLDEKKLIQQMNVIDKLNAKFRNSPSAPSFQKRGRREFKILKGAEVNILKDGSLDIRDEVLTKLDVVGVSIHSHFKMSRLDMTKRIIRALSNPNVDIFFHPTTRIINRRGSIDFDFAEILKAAKKHKVALEINSYPDRLDIHDTLIRRAVEAGVKLTIDSDAHSVKHFGFLRLGEAQARRGWATRGDVLNIKPVGELLKYFAGQ